jgi:hypothetical protein
MGSYLGKRIISVRPICMKQEDENLDNDSLFNEYFLMVDGKLRGEKGNNGRCKSVIAEFNGKKTMEIVKLDAMFDLKIVNLGFKILIEFYMKN